MVSPSRQELLVDEWRAQRPKARVSELQGALVVWKGFPEGSYTYPHPTLGG